MNKIIKSSLAVALLTGISITSASAKEISYSDVAAISEDPIYVRGSSVFVNKITMTDVLHADAYDSDNQKKIDGNLYLKVGKS